MKTLQKIVLVSFFYVLLVGSNTLTASELVHDFSNPSFSGNGYSTHVLSLEQLRYSRENKVKDDQKSADAAAKRDENNTTINKFIKNVESRIYANLSKQLVDNMFGVCESDDTACSEATTGTAEVEGATLTWVRDEITDTITLTILDVDGTTTELTVPISGFAF